MITIVLSYYNSGGMFDRHLTEWTNYSPAAKKQYSAVIVDDGSEKDPAKNHLRDVGFEVRLFRIKQNLVWNVAGARNLGMYAADDGWCLLTDIDHLLLAWEAEKLLQQEVFGRTEKAFVFKRRWVDGEELNPHMNSYLLTRDMYWRCGGCDEDFTGFWGAGERPFRKMLYSLTKFDKYHPLPVYLVHFGRHNIADASTRDWGRRDSAWDWARSHKLSSKVKGPPYRPVEPLRFEWERVA